MSDEQSNPVLSSDSANGANAQTQGDASNAEPQAKAGKVTFTKEQQDHIDAVIEKRLEKQRKSLLKSMGIESEDDAKDLSAKRQEENTVLAQLQAEIKAMKERADAQAQVAESASKQALKVKRESLLKEKAKGAADFDVLLSVVEKHYSQDFETAFDGDKESGDKLTEFVQKLQKERSTLFRLGGGSPSNREGTPLPANHEKNKADKAEFAQKVRRWT